MKIFFKNLALMLAVVFTISACSALESTKELESEDDQKALIETAATNFESEKFTMEGKLSTSEGGVDLNMDLTMSKDGDNFAMIWKTGESALYMRDVDGISYISNDGEEWFDLGEGNESTSGLTETVDTDFLGDDLNADNYTYLGIEDCDGDDCHVFEFKDEETDEVSKLYIHAKDERVVKMTAGSDEEKTEFNINYDDVSIEAPEDATKLSEEEAGLKVLEIFFGSLGGAGLEL